MRCFSPMSFPPPRLQSIAAVEGTAPANTVKAAFGVTYFGLPGSAAALLRSSRLGSRPAGAPPGGSACASEAAWASRSLLGVLFLAPLGLELLGVVVGFGLLPRVARRSVTAPSGSSSPGSSPPWSSSSSGSSSSSSDASGSSSSDSRSSSSSEACGLVLLGLLLVFLIGGLRLVILGLRLVFLGLRLLVLLSATGSCSYSSASGSSSSSARAPPLPPRPGSRRAARAASSGP